MAQTSKTGPLEIGPIQAVVGVNGWQCCLCNTTFPRSFSIEHHMITSHHPLPQPQVVASHSQQAEVVSYGAHSIGRTLDLNISDGLSGRSSHEVHMDVTTSSAAAERTSPNNSGSDRHEAPRVIANETAVAGNIAQNTRKQPCQAVVKEEPGEDQLGSFPVAMAPQLRNAFAEEETSQDEALPIFFPGTATGQQVGQPTGSKNQNASGESSLTSPKTKVPRMSNSGLAQTSFNCEGHHGSRTEDGIADSTFFPQREPMAQTRVSASCKPIKRRICSCGEAFETKQDFRHHRRVVHCKLYKKMFVCHICNAQYPYKRGLNRHLMVKGTEAVECSHCLQRFHDQVSLSTHSAQCHSRKESELAGEDGAYDAGPQSCDTDTGSQYQGKELWPWECSKCKQHFFHKGQFRKHLQACGILHFKGSHQSFHCNLCGAIFRWLKDFHVHYVNVHKLTSSARSTISPAQLDSSPFPGNSPVPSPCPSVTSEINTAMAGVDLNKSSASSTAENTNSLTGTIDLTAGPDWTAEVSERFRSDEGSGASSNPQSLTSDTSSLEHANDRDVIILSDTEDSRSSDSDGDGWEMISEHPREKHQYGKKNQRWEAEAQLQEEFPPSFPFPHYRPPPPPPPHPFRLPPPPPPPFYADHPDTAPGSHRFPPPFPHHHHHHRHHGHRHHHHGFHRGHHDPRFSRGGFFLGRGAFHMPFFGAERFAYPGWFQEQESDNDEGQSHANETESGGKPKSSTSPSSANSSQAGTSAAGSAAKDEDSGHSGDGPSSSQEAAKEDSVPDTEADPFVAWMEQMQENKCAKKMMKKAFWSIVASCRQGKTFFFCPDCLQAFSEESELDKHSKESHSGSAQYACLLCKQSFSSPLDYNKHIRQHCQTFAQMRGRGRGRRGWMMNWGGGMGHFLKMLCKGGPFWPPGQHFGQQQGSQQDCSDGSDSGSEEFKECPFCQKKFRANSRENYFERHVNSHLGVDTFNFKCEVEECGKTFLEKGKYIAHKASHGAAQVHVCQECGKSYQNKTSLTRHQRIHTGERPYKCTECGEGFIENRDLVRHRSVHTGQAAFQCEECGQGFTLKASLLTHMRNKHLGQRPFTCTDCSQNFASSFALVRHQKTCTTPQGGGEVVESGTEDSVEVKKEPTSMDLDCSD